MSVKQEIAKLPSQSAYVSNKPFLNQRTFLDNKHMADIKESHSPSGIVSGNWKILKPSLATVTSQKDLK
jgi:hypothetical protein